MLSTSAEAARGHLLDLLQRVRHHRQRAERERRVRGLVHDDVVGDLVDERLALANQREIGACRSCRSSQSEHVDRAVAGADLGQPLRDRPRGRRAPLRAPRPRGSARARAAPRAWPSACSRRRGSPQPRAARPGISTCRSPSKRWSTGRRRARRSRSPPARRARPAVRQALASARRRRGLRLDIGSASPRSRAGRAARPASATASSRSSRAPELATITGSTTSGTGCSARKSATARSAGARRASRSWPRRRRCRRRRPRAARARSRAAARAPR